MSKIKSKENKKSIGENPITKKSKGNYVVNSAMLQTDYTAVIDEKEITIKAGSEALPALTDEQIRQLLIAGIILKKKII